MENIDNSNIEENKETSENSEVNQISDEKKYATKFQYKLIALLSIAFAILLTFSIISYTSKDEFNSQVTLSELVSLVFGNELIEAKAATTQNWLGLLGAYLSHNLINNTFGFLILIIPLLIIIWSGIVLANKEISKNLIRRTYLSIIISILFSSFVGALQRTSSFSSMPKEFSGAIGLYISNIFISIFGLGLAIFVIFLIIIIVFMIGFSYNFKGLFNYLRLSLAKILVKNKPLTTIDMEKDSAIKENHITNQEIQLKSDTIQDEHVQTAIKNPPEIINETEINDESIINKNFKYNREKIEDNSSQAENQLSDQPKPKVTITRVIIDENDTFVGSGRDFLDKPINKMPDKPVNPFDVALNKVEEKNQVPIESPINQHKELIENVTQSAIKMDETKVDVVENIIDAKPKSFDISLPKIVDNQNLNDNIKNESNNLETELNENRVEEKIETEIKIETKPVIDLKPFNEEEVIPKILENEKIEIPNPQQKQLNVTVTEIVESKPNPYNVQNLLGTYIHEEDIVYLPPNLNLLIPGEEKKPVSDDELRMNAQILQEKLETFKIYIENLSVTPGPVVTQYEFIPAAGIKISRIESLADDLAMALKAKGIRIIAPIPGKGTVGVEIPNSNPSMVRFSQVVNTNTFHKANAILPLGLGMTISGEIYILDLAKMPHLLIAGATGAGKSVGVNTIITSLIYKLHPSELKFVMIDPKKVELQQYSRLRDHFMATSPDVKDVIITKPEEAVLILKSAVAEMELRYDILASAKQRNIAEYNAKVKEGKFENSKDMIHRPMPYIVVIIDELADLMLTASKEIEEPIIRLAQMARAVGIHLIIATQRPSVDVITGIIKANFPARIAYSVKSKIDSRTILDMQGADQLLGMGDMLCLPQGASKPIRVQNAFISTDEVEGICEYIGNQKGYSDPYFLPSVAEKSEEKGPIDPMDRDPLFEEAARLIIRNQQGSVSLLQRRLKVGYARAGRIVDELEDAGVVGPFDGSKARLVLMSSESDLDAIL